MKVAEIFHSLQGEGALLGTPSVFVRLSGCNLRCRWCDTPYASWSPEGKTMAADEVMRQVAREKTRHVVVTGGEPMIFPEVVELTQLLRAADHHITIETAGTVVQPVECDLMSVSPKLSNSAPDASEHPEWTARQEARRINKDVLQQLVDGWDYQLKFVIIEREDLDEMEELLRQLDRIDREKVFLMAEGVEAETLRERGCWLAQEALARGLRFTPRLHVELWGNRRGV